MRFGNKTVTGVQKEEYNTNDAATLGGGVAEEPTNKVGVPAVSSIVSNTIDEENKIAKLEEEKGDAEFTQAGNIADTAFDQAKKVESGEVSGDTALEMYIVSSRIAREHLGLRSAGISQESFNGYSTESKTRIAQEGFIDTVKEAVMKMIEWIKAKIKKLVDWFRGKKAEAEVKEEIKKTEENIADIKEAEEKIETVIETAPEPVKKAVEEVNKAETFDEKIEKIKKYTADEKAKEKITDSKFRKALAGIATLYTYIDPEVLTKNVMKVKASDLHELIAKYLELNDPKNLSWVPDVCQLLITHIKSSNIDMKQVKNEIKEIIKSKIGTSAYSKYYNSKYNISTGADTGIDLSKEKSLLLLADNLIYVDDTNLDEIISFRYYINSRTKTNGLGSGLNYVKEIHLGRSWIGQISYEEMKSMSDMVSKAVTDFTKSDVWNKIFNEMGNVIQEITNKINNKVNSENEEMIVIRRYVNTLSLLVNTVKGTLEKNRDVCVYLSNISEYTKDSLEHLSHLFHTDYGDKGSDTTFVL